jgi:hypothetical protein
VKFSNIVVLTGAGISAESGLKTLRDNDGLWEEYRLENAATPKTFARVCECIYRFYNFPGAQLTSPPVKPNVAHKALAKLEQGHRSKVFIVTQNIDDLYEWPGSQNVLLYSSDPGILIHVAYSLLGLGLLITTILGFLQIFSYIAAAYLGYLAWGAFGSQLQEILVIIACQSRRVSLIKKP